MVNNQGRLGKKKLKKKEKERAICTLSIISLNYNFPRNLLKILPSQ